MDAAIRRTIAGFGRTLRPTRDCRRFDGPLHDPARLAANAVPEAAAAGLSLDTAGRVGNLRAWVTNEFESTSPA